MWCRVERARYKGRAQYRLTSERLGRGKLRGWRVWGEANGEGEWCMWCPSYPRFLRIHRRTVGLVPRTRQQRRNNVRLGSTGRVALVGAFTWPSRYLDSTSFFRPSEPPSIISSSSSANLAAPLIPLSHSGPASPVEPWLAQCLSASSQVISVEGLSVALKIEERPKCRKSKAAFQALGVVSL